MSIPGNHPGVLASAAAAMVLLLPGSLRAGGQGPDSANNSRAIVQLYAPPSSRRVTVPLDSSWRFMNVEVMNGPEAPHYDDSLWQIVSLPHTWNNLDGQDGGNDYYRGAGWYRRHLVPDTSLAGRRLYLQFDGASIVTDLFVNGVGVGEHKGGFAAFTFDVTDRMKLGADNVIAVRVSNARDPDVPPLDADFTFFGGLYRSVRLLATDRLAITPLDYGSPGVYLKQTNVDAHSADLQALIKVLNASDVKKHVAVRTTIVDAGGSVIAAMQSASEIGAHALAGIIQNTTIKQPHLWNGRADPYLYRAYVELRDSDGTTDLVSQPLGFRFFSVDHDRGFFLNGRRFELHGVNKHQDRLNKGWAINEADMDEDFSLMMEMGTTAVRLAHYQHPGHEYDLADRDGLVIWAEIPLVDRITATPEFARNAKQQLIELIRQNYNHPSIIFWSVANEITLLSGPPPDGLIAELALLANREDPTRLSAIASAAGDRDPTNYHTDVVGFNKYFGWYVGTLHDFAPWVDGLHGSDTSAAHTIGITEYGAGAGVTLHSDSPVVMDHTEEYQCLFHETYLRVMQQRPFVWGSFVWNMFDFAVDSRTEGDTKGRNDKGLVTYDRKTKKDAFYWYKANWSSDPVVYITERRFTPRPHAVITVKVYSNMDSVELVVNGISQGSHDGSGRNVLWPDVHLKEGRNTVKAIGLRNGSRLTDEVVWEYK